MKWTMVMMMRLLTIRTLPISIWTKTTKTAWASFMISSKIWIKQMTMINMANETLNKSLMISTLTQTTFQQVKIDQTVMMLKKRRMKMKTSTIQEMMIMNWMNQKSLKRTCNRINCLTCQISLLLKRGVILTLDQIKCTTKSNMTTSTQKFEKLQIKWD